MHRSQSASLIALIVAIVVAVAASAQEVQDGDASSAYVAPGSAATLNYFGVCIIVNNSNTYGAQYEFSTAAEWADFVAHPDPGVTHTPCGSTNCPAQVVSWAVSGATCIGPIGSLTDGQKSPLVTATQGVDGSAGNGSAKFQCKSGALVVQSSNCSVPAATFCTDSTGAQHAIGSTWTALDYTAQEPCSSYSSAYTSGEATAPVNSSFQCNAGGTISTLSTTLGAWDTSACRNVAGGACLPVSASTCTAMNSIPADQEPSCLWEDALPQTTLTATGLQTCYVAGMTESVLTYKPSSDLCSCVGTPTAIGVVAQSPPMACGSPTAPSGCPGQLPCPATCP